VKRTEKIHGTGAVVPGNQQDNRKILAAQVKLGIQQINPQSFYLFIKLIFADGIADFSGSKKTGRFVH